MTGARSGATDDDDLLPRLRARDAAAERAFYDRYVDFVYRTAFRLCGDRDVAADYTQEAFFRAFKNLAQFRGDAPIGAWLRAIVTSVAFRGGERRRREQATLEFGTGADARDPRAEVTFDVRDRVTEALDRMPGALRVVFLMHDVEGYRHDEIAAAMSIAVGTSRARLSQARSRLRVALADYAQDARS